MLKNLSLSPYVFSGSWRLFMSWMLWVNLGFYSYCWERSMNCQTNARLISLSSYVVQPLLLDTFLITLKGEGYGLSWECFHDHDLEGVEDLISFETIVYIV